MNKEFNGLAALPMLMEVTHGCVRIRGRTVASVQEILKRWLFYNLVPGSSLLTVRHMSQCFRDAEPRRDSAFGFPKSIMAVCRI